ncbi:hypothetical protein FHJ30_11315 [Arthrobacter sp. BB-1]|jgi:hypothetical protein|uniref:hypothetical protein n=1 Tax=Micrococcaceae TaxID=1268 RepID=UPI0011120E39|nr:MULTISPECIES: hypothetical protein [Micrococcaceae]TNB72138.1 hypothetical protein FHJ30_11315 [Arthrobacter sp. BB-1]UEL27064.1 hypothetical protein KTR40_10380 [Pseudarthrobacter sp. L1SW]
MADSTKIVSAIVFVIAVLLWAAFGAVLLVRQGNLADLWAAFRGQPWVLQGLEFLVLLPWTAALWVWNTAWELWIRALLLVGLAWVSLYLLFPWRSG